jgi:hypothetical protein
MILRDACPQGTPPKEQTNGPIHNGTPNPHGHDCGRPCVQGFAARPEHLQVQPVTGYGHVMSRRLKVEAEARSRLVQQQARQHGIGLAIDATTRQGMACPGGDSRRKRAQRLWAKSPRASRQHATVQTDSSGVDAGVMPAAPPRPLTTLARQATHLERVTNIRRQRVSRLGRDALSCSKQLANHSGAMKRCIGHDNLTRAAA